MASKQTSFLDTVKESCAVNKICSSLNISSDMMLYMIMWAGAGCLVGVLFKRCARILVTGAAIAAIIIGGAIHVGIVSVDIVQLKMLFGVPNVDSLAAVISVWGQWIQAHIQVTVSAAVGFLIGFLLG